MARFWFQRTARTCADLLMKELKAGRLRQGWGGLPEQDLRIISEKVKVKQGANLRQDQKDCWRGNRRLLPTEPDSVQPGDYIITPHLPEEGCWSLVKVTGGYSYEIHPEAKDFGHILEVELLNPHRPINPRCAAVAAALRRTATARSRMWNVDHLDREVCRLVEAVERGEDVSQPEPEGERLASVQKCAAAAIEDELRKKFHGAEFEKPVEWLLRRIYEKVERPAGPNERGADFICSAMDGLGIELKVAVQVKMWEGTATWHQPLDQIRRAYESYEDPKISAGVVLAMVNNFEKDFEEARDRLETELEIPIRLMHKEDVVNLFMEHLPDLAGETRA